MPEKNKVSEWTKLKKALKAYRRIYGDKRWWYDSETRRTIKRHQQQLYQQQIEYEGKTAREYRRFLFRLGYRKTED